MAKKNSNQLKKAASFVFWPLLLLLLLSVFWPKRNLVWERQEQKRIEKEIRQWEQTLEKYPDYRDLYLKLVVLNWQVNNHQKAQEYLQKAKELDPNFQTTKEIEKALTDSPPVQ